MPSSKISFLCAIITCPITLDSASADRPFYQGARNPEPYTTSPAPTQQPFLHQKKFGAYLVAFMDTQGKEFVKVPIVYHNPKGDRLETILSYLKPEQTQPITHEVFEMHNNLCFLAGITEKALCMIPEYILISNQ